MLHRASSLTRRFGTHQQRIMVTMIGAFDLHHFVAPGVRTSDTQGIHRRLGPGVAEAYQFDWRETTLHLFCQENGIGAGQRVEAALAKLVAQGFHQHGVRVANKQAAETQVKISVLVAVIVPDMAPLRPADKQRIRRHGLERTGYSHRQRRQRPPVNLVGARSALSEFRFLAGNNLFHHCTVKHNWFSKHKTSFPERGNMRPSVNMRHRMDNNVSQCASMLPTTHMKENHISSLLYPIAEKLAIHPAILYEYHIFPRICYEFRKQVILFAAYHSCHPHRVST